MTVQTIPTLIGGFDLVAPMYPTWHISTQYSQDSNWRVNGQLPNIDAWVADLDIHSSDLLFLPPAQRLHILSPARPRNFRGGRVECSRNHGRIRVTLGGAFAAIKGERLWKYFSRFRRDRWAFPTNAKGAAQVDKVAGKRERRLPLEWQMAVLGQTRKVHVALMGLSFALVVAATLLPSASVDEAYHDLETIQTINTKYFALESAKPRFGAQKVDFLATRDSYQPLPQLLDFAGSILDQLYFQFDSNVLARVGSFSFTQTLKTAGAKREVQLLTNMPIIFAPETLDQFKADWDFLAKAHLAQVSSPDLAGIRAFRLGTPVDLKEFRRTPAEAGGKQAVLISARLGILEHIDPVRTFAPREWFMVVELEPTAAMYLPFDEIHVPIRVVYTGDVGAQAVLIPASDNRVPLGEFDHAFGDLARLAKGLETLRIDQLLDYVRRLRDDEGRSISLLGVSVPRRVVSQWGIALLIALQIYFILHLEHARGLKFSPQLVQTYPWIGVYQGKLARFTFVVSVSALPLAALAALVWGGVSSSGFDRRAIPLLIAASLSMAAALWTGSRVLTLPSVLSSMNRHPSERRETAAAAD
jgi:hypothetical protein